MSAQPQFDKPWISIEEFLAAELVSDIKHEDYDGAVVAMTGGSLNHVRIAGNMFAELRNHLHGMPCERFTADIKVKIGKHFFNPDTMVVCESLAINDDYTETPVLSVEVPSKSSRRRDETIKRRLYQTIPSLQEFVLIEQDIADVEVCRRSEGWVSNHYFLGDELPYESVGLTVSVAEIYARVMYEDVASFLLEQQQASTNSEATGSNQ